MGDEMTLTAGLVIQLLDTYTFSDRIALLGQTPDHNSAPYGIKGQKPSLHMYRGKAVYPRDYPGCLGARRSEGIHH